MIQLNDYSEAQSAFLRGYAPREPFPIRKRIEGLKFFNLVEKLEQQYSYLLPLDRHDPCGTKELNESKKPKRKRRFLPTTRLLNTDRWRALRIEILTRDGSICKRCAKTSQLQVDHILPKSKHPNLMFEPSNLQVLCMPCNFRKRREEE